MGSKISLSIQEYLIKRKVTITELANRLDVSKQRISYMLLNKEDGNWKISNLIMIAGALKVEFKEFLLEVLFNDK